MPEPASEGVIKFRCEWTDADAVSASDIAPLLPWRRRLFERGWIGENAAGIGYGNLSLRAPPLDGGPIRLIVTASQTSHLPEVGPEQFSLVTDWDLAANLVRCEGRMRASAETLTHATIYAFDPAARAVFHIHHLAAWRRLLGRAPTTRADVAYGSPEMAQAVRELLEAQEVREAGFFVMGGHEEGLIAFGPSPDAAGAALEHWMKSAQE
jgi:L-ribulose-5-phosphate 4-epimerase